MENPSIHFNQSCQWTKLPTGETMIRGPKGTLILPPLPELGWERFLGFLKNSNSFKALQIKLPNYMPEDLYTILKRLEPQVIRLDPEPKAEQPWPIYIYGDPKGVSSLQNELGNQGLRSTYLKTFDPPTDFGLVIQAHHGKSYGHTLEQNLNLAKLGLPTVTFLGDAGRIVRTPLLLNGSSACAKCIAMHCWPIPKLSATKGLEVLSRLKIDLASDPQTTALAFRDLALDLSRLAQDKAPQKLFTHRVHYVQQQPRYQLSGIHSQCPTCNQGFQPHPQTQELQKHVLHSRHQIISEYLRSQKGPAGNETKQKVAILGGGSAGYLTALALQAKHPNLDLTLIESSKRPIIGVGEATTPLMPQFLHNDLGIDITRFFREVQPTIKLGIQFHWGKDADSWFNYPFGGVRPLENQLYQQNIYNCSFASVLMNQRRLPHIRGSQEWLDHPEFAYHLDNKRFVRFLQTIAQERQLLIKDVLITGVRKNSDHIKAIKDESGEEHEFDIFIDCSGFAGKLIGDALKSPWVSFAKQLSTNSAIVASAPREAQPRPYTTASTMNAGWYWDIPQKEERHLGYVFDSNYLSPEEAENEFRERHPDLGPTRLIKYRTGRRQHFLKGNVFALGNAYGFVEPLESTALHMLIRQIGLISGCLPLQTESSGLAAHLNKRVATWWEYLRFFLAIHYRYNHAAQTPFWQDARKAEPVKAFQHLVHLFQESGPLSHLKSIQNHFEYPDPLWGAEGIDIILMGLGVPTKFPTSNTSSQAWERWYKETQELMPHLSTQGELLNVDEAILPSLQRIIASVGKAF